VRVAKKTKAGGEHVGADTAVDSPRIKSATFGEVMGDAALREAYKKDLALAAEAVRERLPRVGAHGVFGLTLLEGALRNLDSAAAKAESIREANPQGAARMMVAACLDVLRQAQADGPLLPPPRIAGEAILTALIDALDDMERGNASELFAPRSTKGAPRLGVNDERMRFWAAVSMDFRAALTGSITAASKAIMKELALPRDTRGRRKGGGRVDRWREDILSYARGAVLKREFDRLTEGVRLAPKQPLPDGVRKETFEIERLAFERDYLDRAKDYARAAVHDHAQKLKTE
jgi:hypothetical protein